MRSKIFSSFSRAVLFALAAIIVPLEISATPPVPVVPPSEAECVKPKRAARLTINDDPSFTLTVDDEHVGYGYRSPGPFDKGGYLRFTYLSDGTTYQFQNWDSLKCHAITRYDSSLSGSGSPSPTSTRRPTRTPRPNPTPKPIVTINRQMNVRRGPGTNYPVMGTAAPGQEYIIIGRNSNGDWWRINYNGRIGWVYAPLVKTSTNAASVRRVPSPSLPTPTSTPERTLQISYEELFRNAERYRGQLVYYRGEVIQALEDRCVRRLLGLCLEEGNVLNYQLRVNVTPSGWFWVDTVFLRYDNAPARIIEGDIISFVAQVNGVITYESILGTSVTIPDLTAVKLVVE